MLNDSKIKTSTLVSICTRVYFYFFFSVIAILTHLELTDVSIEVFAEDYMVVRVWTQRSVSSEQSGFLLIVTSNGSANHDFCAFCQKSRAC
jgi:hypothetical protein